MANGLYTPNEIAVMTDDALDELLSHYSDTGNAQGVQMVREEQDTRCHEIEEDRLSEMEWEAEQDRRQQLHDEWLDHTLAEDGRWG